jgi:hypothetical protein
MKAFAPLALTIASLDTIWILQAFHPSISPSSYPKFFMDF